MLFYITYYISICFIEKTYCQNQRNSIYLKYIFQQPIYFYTTKFFYITSTQNFK
jgi:hypothetical protein